ncbi:MAG: leucine-rich repeat domain-containing protein [Ruminococcaceae bacterium]|nr:leucine-rich repeat domain-containing protein [Oscillospiraceae bacterium]
MKKNKLIIAAVIACALLLGFLSIRQCMNMCVGDYSLVVSDASELEELDKYPNLKTVDLTGSTCYDAIEEYIEAHPQISVKYDVQIGSGSYANDSESLTFADGSYDCDQLVERLAHFRDLTGLNLPQTTLSSSQLSAIREAYPDITVDYSVMLLGQDIPKDVSSLDLSAMDASQLDEVAERLGNFTNLAEISLMDENGSSPLSVTEVKKLCDAAPGVFADYSFELFGKKLTTADETMEFVKADIGNDGVQSVRDALDIMPRCTYCKLDNCGVDNEVMAKLRDDYPGVKVVWRVFIPRISYLTDVEMIHWTESVNNDEIQVLQYCTDLKYLDLGHNSRLADISFVRSMPKLKIAILVDSKISDLGPLASCPDLEHLEIVNCRQITDLSPLASCKNLKRLNISSAFGVTDLSPLYSLQSLERLYVGGNWSMVEEVSEARKMLPNCWVTNLGEKVFNVSGNYAVGWRLERDLSFADWYKEMREIFQYDVIKGDDIQ